MAFRYSLQRTLFSSRSVVLRQSTYRELHLASILKASQALEDAKQRVTTLKEDPGNMAKLKLYALFKQATNGPCNAPKPGTFDFVGQAKWSAWDSLGDMSKEDAEKAYIEYVDELSK